MKASIPLDGLKTALAAVCRATAVASTRTELCCALMVAGEDSVEFSATDGTHSTRVMVPALVERVGRALVPAQRLSDVARTLPDGAVSIDATEKRAEIDCVAASLVLPALDPFGFPSFPRVDPDASVTLPFAPLKAALQRAMRFVKKPGKDGKSDAMCGVLIEWSDGELRVVSTDGVRVSIERIPIGGSSAGSVVSPARLIADVIALDTPGTVTIGASENQVSVAMSSVSLVARRLAGTYPNWRLFDELKSYVARAVFDRNELLAAARRTLALGQGGQQPKLAIVDGCVSAVVSRCAGEDGESCEDVACSGATGTADATLNGVYLAAALAAVPTDEVVIEIGEGRNPVMFMTRGGEYKCATMPIWMG